MPRYGKLNVNGEVAEEVISDQPRAGYIELPADGTMGDRLVGGRKIQRTKDLTNEIEPDYDMQSDLGKEIARKKPKEK